MRESLGRELLGKTPREWIAPPTRGSLAILDVPRAIRRNRGRPPTLKPSALGVGHSTADGRPTDLAWASGGGLFDERLAESTPFWLRPRTHEEV